MSVTGSISFSAVLPVKHIIHQVISLLYKTLSLVCSFWYILPWWNLKVFPLTQPRAAHKTHSDHAPDIHLYSKKITNMTELVMALWEIHSQEDFPHLLITCQESKVIATGVCSWGHLLGEWYDHTVGYLTSCWFHSVFSHAHEQLLSNTIGQKALVISSVHFPKHLSHCFFV